MAEQIEEKLCRYDCLFMRNKRFPNYDVIGYMVWQPYWIEGKYFLNLLKPLHQIDVKLQNYDPVVMGNTCFKSKPDQIHGLAARIIEVFLNLHSF